MKNLIALALFLFPFSVMGQNFDTEFKYTDSINKGIPIQNSYPKGGERYTGPNCMVRAGFELQKQELLYKINNFEINCGQVTKN